MDGDGGAAALAADVGGGLFRAVGAIAMLLVEDDGFSDGDGDVAPVGARLGLEEVDVGAADGNVDGKGEGSDVGAGVGVSVGEGVGADVGSGVGVSVGEGVGADVGSGVGASVGEGVGVDVGSGAGASVGEGVGVDVGSGVGVSVGEGVGVDVGSGVGVSVGDSVVGTGVGAAVGAGDGDGLGDCVQTGVLHAACSVVNGHGVPVPSEILVTVRWRLERPPPPANVGWGEAEVRASDRKAYTLRCSCPIQSKLMLRGFWHSKVQRLSI
jgi:hypothetical protein